nr:hypothetical protein [Eubacterium sp.]
MKYKVIWIMILLLACVGGIEMTSGEANAAGRVAKEEWKKFETGSAGVLEGKSIIVSIFIDDKNSKWTEAAKKKANRKLGVSERYIEKQAKRYGKKVDLVTDIYQNTDLCYVYQTKMNVNDTDKKQDKLYRKIHKYIDTTLPITELREKYDTDSIGFVLHMNKSGVSSTAVHYIEDTKYFYECATLFSKFEGVPEGAATYAHEILHLYGARDLYNESLQDGITFSFVKYIAKRHPNDIMFSTYTMSGKQLTYRIKNEVSRVTAYYLGWKKKILEKKKYPLMRHKKGCFSEGTAWK